MYSLFSNSLPVIVVSSFLQMTLGHSSWLHHLFSFSSRELFPELLQGLGHQRLIFPLWSKLRLSTVASSCPHCTCCVYLSHTQRMQCGHNGAQWLPENRKNTCKNCSGPGYAWDFFVVVVIRGFYGLLGVASMLFLCLRWGLKVVLQIQQNKALDLTGSLQLSRSPQKKSFCRT